MTIRKADESDITDIINLCQKSIRATCTKDYSPEQIDVWCRSVIDPNKWKLAIKGQHFVVAEKLGTMLGFASIKDGEYIVYLYVNPDYQRTGIASFLFESLKEETLRLEKNYIWANVSKTAQPFFQKLGFKVEHERINHLEEVEIRNHRMGLYLKYSSFTTLVN